MFSSKSYKKCRAWHISNTSTHGCVDKRGPRKGGTQRHQSWETLSENCNEEQSIVLLSRDGMYLGFVFVIRYNHNTTTTASSNAFPLPSQSTEVDYYIL